MNDLLLKTSYEFKSNSLTEAELDNIVSHKITGMFLVDYIDKIYEFWKNIAWYPQAEIILIRKIYNLLSRNIAFLEQNELPESYEIIYILWLIDNEYLSYNNACKMLKKELFDYQENSEGYIENIIKTVRKECEVEDPNFLIGKCLKLAPNLNPKKLNELLKKVIQGSMA